MFRRSSRPVTRETFAVLYRGLSSALDMAWASSTVSFKQAASSAVMEGISCFEDSGNPLLLLVVVVVVLLSLLLLVVVVVVVLFPPSPSSWSTYTPGRAVACGKGFDSTWAHM